MLKALTKGSKGPSKANDAYFPKLDRMLYCLLTKNEAACSK
jgi:hypothetical protein